MKRFLLLFLVFWAFPSVAHAKTWDFRQWTSDITVNQDSSILVREQQTFSFTGDFTWVSRDLPKAKGIVYSDIHVYDANGTELSGSDVTIQNHQTSASIVIHFSASNTTKTWTIAYRAWNAIGFFDTYDELYWNAVSIDRDVPINAVTTLVRLPSPSIASSDIRQRLLIGPPGSTNESSDASTNPQDGSLVYQGTNIAPHEAFTIVAGWPKGLVTETKRDVTQSFFWKQWGWFQWIYFASPILLLFFLVRRWRKFGRDPKGRVTIVPQYEPPDNIRPGVMGTLIDEKADMGDITASIIDLAVRGYLLIRETEKTGFLKSKKSYTLERRNIPKRGDTLSKFDTTLLENLFDGAESVELDDLKNIFYKHLKGLKEILYEEATAIGYFEENPEKVRSRYVLFGVLLLFGVFLFVVPAICGVMLIIFGMRMPRRTMKGVLAREWALGFKMYLHTAERFRLQDQKPEYFDQMLPYAMVFGVEKEWASRFVDIYKQPPNWYVGSTMQGFMVMNFASSLSSSFAPSFSQVLASSPSSNSGFGGGGFAGGGGGGGGSGAG
ncbi:MAG: DUF2207 domain-containing protein [bacterium]